jgi:hypothetical protein
MLLPSRQPTNNEHNKVASKGEDKGELGGK